MPSVVVLPGLDGTTELLEDFCKDLRTYRVDARAVAYPRDQAINYDGLEALARTSRPKVTRFVLLGESFSGPLAIRIASDPPSNLMGVVLSTTFARAPVPGLASFAGLVRFAPAHPPMALLSWVLLGPWATPQLRARLSKALRSVSPAALRMRAASALATDVTHLLANVRVPVLQLVASHDRLLANASTAHLARTLPSCRSVTLPGPHLLLKTAFRDAARIVADFTHAVANETDRECSDPRRRN